MLLAKFPWNHVTLYQRINTNTFEIRKYHRMQYEMIISLCYHLCYFQVVFSNQLVVLNDLDIFQWFPVFIYLYS
jgi:hypothetical protein